MQLAILVLVVLLFVLSPNLLYAAGVGYTSPLSSQFAKLHPALYLAVLLLGVAVLRRQTPLNSLVYARGAAWGLACVALTSVLLFAALSVETGGGELSALLVTFLLPALLVLVFGYAGEETLALTGRLLSLLFLVNSIIALMESATGLRILPFVAGEGVLNFDRRPTALLGHPLDNALLTGSWLLLQLMAGFRNGYRIGALAIMTCHLLAMLAFGGRAAFVMMLVSFALYVGYRTLALLLLGRGGAEMLRALSLLGMSALVLPLIFWSGMADGMMERFIDSQGSNETRFAALQILSALEPAQWWIGVPISVRTAMQESVGSVHGIELSWVALLATFGLPITAALLISMLALLRAVGRGTSTRGLLLIGYFVAASFTSLTIGGKSLLLAQFIVLLASASSLRARPQLTENPQQEDFTPLGQVAPR